MMRKKTSPLLALIAFEIAAIVGLQSLGTAQSMQIPWDDLGVWLQTGSIEEIAAPLVRLSALAVAYWLFISTGLFAIAQVSRIPAAIQATSMFTLPSVRRIVDGAIAVSIVTSSFVGLNASTASAQTPTENVITAQAGGDLSVTSPGRSPAAQSELEQNRVPTTGAETETGTTGVAPSGDSPAVNTPGSRTVPVAPTSPSEEGSSSSSTTSSTTSTTVAPSTSAPNTTVPSTSAAPTTAVPRTAPIAPEAGQQFVPTPRPGAPSTSTTTQAPKAPAPQVEAPEVLGASEHRVVAGDNLWTISRDALASATSQKSSDLSDAEIREYWLKVIADNRDNLRSGDPHWIFPGEVISLPSASLPK